MCVNLPVIYAVIYLDVYWTYGIAINRVYDIYNETKEVIDQSLRNIRFSKTNGT